MVPALSVSQITTGANNVCSNPFTLAQGKSCLLNLQINGSQAPEALPCAPVICKTNGTNDNSPDPFLCSKPAAADCLTISVTSDVYTVTPIGDGHVTINPSTPQTISVGSTQSFTVTAQSGYLLSNNVGGTCPIGSWSGNIYTTGASNSSCTVTFRTVNNPVTVTPTGDGRETFIPNTAQIIDSGSTQSFTVTANPGFTVLNAVGGTCPTGSWVGDVYTTGAVTTSCTVSFNASHNAVVVTPQGDGHETISPDGPQTIDYGLTQSFTITANPGYEVVHSVVGVCPPGSWSGNTYTTGPVTANCLIAFSANLQPIVTPSGDGNETFTPSTATPVNSGTTLSFTVTPQAGYTVSQVVGGTCLTGSWSGNNYTTGSITQDCNVIFKANPKLTVTPMGDGHEQITPSSPQLVARNSTQSFKVTADLGYTLSNVVSGTCPQGSWSGNIYTTGAITSSGSVIFSIINTVTPSSTSAADATITPSTPQSVVTNGSVNFQASATGIECATLIVTSGTTCPGSLTLSPTNPLQGNFVATPITFDCNVLFSCIPQHALRRIDKSNLINAADSKILMPDEQNLSDDLLLNNNSIPNNHSEIQPDAPINVIAIPGDGLAKISWTISEKSQEDLFSSYIVKYGIVPLTSTTVGCITKETSCLIEGLTNELAYVFSVAKTVMKKTSIPVYSSATTPTDGLAFNPQSLALSVQNGSPGATRTLTLTNNSKNTITIKTITTNNLPAGTLIIPSQDECIAGATVLEPHESCTLNVKPGAIVSSDASSAPCTIGTEVIPATITAQTNTDESVTAEVALLDYGCIYQGGYIFSIDDSTPTTRSIGGKVAAAQDLTQNLFDQPETSKDMLLLCQQPIDANGNTPCKTEQCYSDWYLPSICEMGHQTTPLKDYCAVPQSQHMQANLVEYNNLNLLSGYYWSSTDNLTSIWYQYFSSTNSYQDTQIKNVPMNIRCIRKLTI